MFDDALRWLVTYRKGSWHQVCTFVALLVVPSLPAAVVINEIHYHPVAESAFDTNGLPLLDLSEDVHEFIELFNTGSQTISLGGWELGGGIHFTFPDSAGILPGQFVVIAKNPVRLASLAPYGLSTGQVLGPWSGNLGNSGDTVRLKNGIGDVVDSVSYSASFPWAIGADALGADSEWTGLKAADYQYRGRSLERVSATWPANDPANWLASPAPGNPSPGRSNAVTRAVPVPIVIAFAAYQSADGDPTIRSNQAVRVDCTFSATNLLGNVVLEYFLDDINSTSETHTSVGMSGTGTHFTTVLPGQADRALVRYRFRADRGAGIETVSPRADDPFGWHAYFVSPLRSSSNLVYDCFISAASLTTLQTNISQSPRRTTVPNPPGTPRASWNATEPAVFVVDGEVFDIRIRYHGSPFRRTPGRSSYKCQFPAYHKYGGQSGMFVTDKTTEYFAASRIYRAAGLPFATVRWVDFYLNSNGLLLRLEESEMDDTFFENFAREWQDANPGTEREATGEFYKSQGTMLGGDPEGPFGAGTFYRMPARPPYWTEVDRYEWTYAVQMHGWKGHTGIRTLAQDMWNARASTNSPDLTALRAFFELNFDMDATLNYLAIRNWSCGWDDIFQNYFLWRRANGKWAMLPWDVDSEIGGRSATTSIFVGELGNASNFWTGPNWLKDSLFKTFRNEFKERLFVLNNTLLSPANLTTMGLSSSLTFANSRLASVNSQLGLGNFERPARPVNVAPLQGLAVLSGTTLQSSAYSHSASPATPHGSTTWFIRANAGSYAAPLFKLTSTSNLTSLPIPFAVLTFGETYFWKCIHTDLAGHPSLESAETSFVFGAVPAILPLVALDPGTMWRYSPSVSSPSNWFAPGFDDSAWPQGAGLLGIANGPVPEPVRTPLAAGGRMTYCFRTAFNFTGDPGTTRLRLRHVVDDGVVIYLNGIEILRTGMHDGLDSSGEPAIRNVANAVYEGPFTVSAASLVRGTNVLAAEVHQFNSSSTDVIFGLTLDALVPPAPGAIVLNEVLADNRGSVANGSSSPDYVELYNNTDQELNLSGLSLSDNTLLPGRYIFPPNTLIPARGYLVVWCDDATNAPGLHTGFGLDNDGQTVALFVVNTNGYTLSDSVTFGLQAPDYAIGRAPAAIGPWQLTAPTAGAANTVVPLGNYTGLKLNEWMATDASGADWLELFNASDLPVALGGFYFTDNPSTPTRSPVRPLSFIAPLAFARWIADSNPDAGARHLNFRLSGNGETVELYDPNLYLVDTITFGPQTTGVSQGRLPDGGTNMIFFPFSASPGEPNYLPLEGIVVSEVLAHSDPPLQDVIELFNSSGASVDISGWWLSDSSTRPRKFPVPAHTILPPGGYVVFYENQFNPDPNLAASFALDGAHGDQVHLSAALSDGSLTGYRTDASFGPAENGVSHGRFATSRGIEFGALEARTFGSVNSGPKVGPVVITEIYYHPPDGLDGSDSVFDEFIELRNISGTNVALFDPALPANTWRLRDAVDFSFPAGVTLAAGETVIIVGFNPTNATLMDAFATDLGSGVRTARVFGPWNGKLDNKGDHVELIKPDVPVTTPGPDMGFVPSILVDQVHYTDRSPWPSQGDGDGTSLQRLVLTGYGNDPVNWFADVPTAGKPFIVGPPPAITSQPTNVSVLRGLTATFSVTVTGTPPFAYQWQFNGNSIIGANRSVLVISNVDYGQAGTYRVQVIGAGNVVKSDYAVLNVLVPASITLQPVSVDVRVLPDPGTDVAPSTNASFSVAGTTLNPPLSFQWRKAGMNLTASTKFAGCSTPNLTVSNVVIEDYGEYSCAVTDGNGTIYSSNAVLYPLVRPTVWIHPATQTVPAYSPVPASLVLSNGFPPPYRYTWYRGSVPFATNISDSKTNFMIIPEAIVGNASSSYTVRLTNRALTVPVMQNAGSFTLTIAADADLDGMPDAYELTYTGSTTSLDPAGDLDGDGMSNLSEFLAGTDPADASSYLRIDQTRVPGMARVEFAAISNRTYSVQYSVVLPAANWRKLADVVSQPTNRVELIFDPQTNSNRFYRVVTPRQP